MTTRYYKYERNARAAARKVGLDPDAVVQPCAAGFWSVDFAGIADVVAEDLGRNDVEETSAEPVAAEPVEDKPAPEITEMVLANAHLDGIPANGSPGPQLLADLFNKPIEEMRAAKEAEVELPECLKREATAEETARIAQHAKELVRSFGEKVLPRYFSMPSSDVGSEVFKNSALYCCPWVRSLIHSPDAVIHSPAEITAACPTTVTRSRWPRALIRRTQKPFSTLWYVTRSTRPARTSWFDRSGCGFMRIVASLR